jgi:hypothetical protein
MDEYECIFESLVEESEVAPDVLRGRELLSHRERTGKMFLGNFDESGSDSAASGDLSESDESACCCDSPPPALVRVRVNMLRRRVRHLLRTRGCGMRRGGDVILFRMCKSTSFLRTWAKYCSS